MDIKALASFKALADPTRLRILHLLLERELNVNEVVSILDIGQSGISRHLKILADSGLVRCRKDGLWSFYSADADGEQAALLRLLPHIMAGEPQLREDEKTAARIIARREKETRRLFDSLAPRWEEMKREILGGFDLNKVIADRIPKTGTAADLGCGTGDFLEKLARRAHKVIGVDASPEMIRAARERFAEHNGAVEVRMGEFEHLPLADGEVDAAICNMVLHHLPDPRRGLAEVARALKPGGRFILADFQSHEDETLRTRYGDRRLGFNPKTVETWLGKAGFAPIIMEKHPVNRNLTVLVFSAEKK
jgi:ubiquinone/menaquinone biosynthesis C-methylase UbiE